MRVVLTGASGTVGSHLATAIHQTQHTLITVGRKRPPSLPAGQHLQADLANLEECERAGQHLADNSDMIADAVVLAAGIDSHQGISDLDPRVFLRTMHVNCLGQLRLLSGVLSGRAPGATPLRVCAVSSDVVGRPCPGTVAYAASKAALEEALSHATADAPMTVLLARLRYTGQPMRELAEGGTNAAPADPPDGEAISELTAQIIRFIDADSSAATGIGVWP